jgi:Right handed beta helix region/Protein of unknown function (DUF1565)
VACKSLHQVLSLRRARCSESRGRLILGQWLGVVASLVPLTACEDPRVPVPPPPFEEASPTASSGAVLTATGRRYYVDPSGSDSTAGSSTAPFRSIQRAADAARPGDTVLVRPGTYTGSDRIVSLTRSGGPGAWITFRSEQKGRAVLDGRNGASLEAWYFGPGVAYVRVEGFEIRGLREHAFDTYGGGVHEILIVGNHVHHIGRNCTDTSNGRTGASLGAGASRVTLDANVWHDIGRLAPGEKGCFPKTPYYQNHDHGIYIADADDVVIINNVFANFRRGWAVHRYSSRGVATRGLLIANNTFVGENPYRTGQIILAAATAGLRIENNIFHAPREAALYFENLRFPDGTVRYNMVSGGAIKMGRPTGLTITRNWEHTDPGFSSTGDFRLAAGSPALDVGLLLSEVRHDAEGVERPRGRGVDLGAYER